jgi:integrase
VTGAWFYFGYKHEGKSRKAPLLVGGAPFDPEGKRGLTLVQARDIAAELGKIYRSGVSDIRGHMLREAAVRVAAVEAAEAAERRELELAQQGSLHALLDAYAGHLEAHGKTAARNVRNVFKLHVPAELAQRRAAQLGMADFLPSINALVEAGKGPTARMLRSYLRAAYALALASQSDPAAPQALRGFGIEHNPVAAVSTRGLARFNRRRTRVLSDDELAGYLRGLEGIQGRSEYLRDALTVALYLGGQRIDQLLRLTWAQVDLSGGTVTLFDRKGRRDQPREHVLPLTAVPLGVLKRRHQLAAYDPRVFATATRNAMGRKVAKISAAMNKARIARSPFELRDIRRTAETMLGGDLDVSKDIRAQIQSHGLGGVQDRHYDMATYLKQKRAALEKWAGHLKGLRQRPAPDTEGAPGR